MNDGILQSVRAERCVWRELAESREPVILYGTGDGADKVLAAFEKYGIRADGAAANDEFVRGQSFRGFEVKRLSYFESRFKSFTLALCFASQIPQVINTIKSAAARHRLLVPSVPVFGGVLFDDDFIKKNSADICRAYELLEDELSRRTYENILKFYYSGRLELLDEITCRKSEAFENILRLGGSEVYVDLGAYDGDTIDEFLKYSGGGYRKIIALEPNEKNFSRLERHCENMDRVVLWKLGAYSKNTVLRFNGKTGRNSAASEDGTVLVKAAAVDSLLCGITPTYVKADVEGADFEALRGMSKTLRESAPKLNFSVYHRFEDIFRLPLYIKSLNPNYRIYLRHHPYIPAWDTNIYCI